MANRNITTESIPRFWFMVLIIFLLSHPGSAWAKDAATSFLIKHVKLLEGPSGSEYKVVNVLVLDRQLDIVSTDQIPADGIDQVIDAQHGYLLGNLTLDAPPSFVIVDRDPRENFEVLINSRQYVKLAVQDGVIVKNTLILPLEDEAPEEKPGSGWLAYTPPPFALPISYRDEKKWNRFETRYVSGLFNGALAIDRQRWLTQDSASEQQVGTLSEFDGGEIRALRFGLVGTLNFDNPWVYVIAGATNGFTRGFDTTETDDFTWFDYRLDIPLSLNTTLSIGKQKEPISMERLTGMVFLPWQERSAASDAMMPSRNHGIVLNGVALDGWMTWAAGVFNNWIDSDESFSETADQVISRLTWVPAVSADESNLVHLGIGFRYTNAQQGIRYRTEPEFDQSPDFVDTGLLEAEAALTSNLEISWRKGPFWLASEYLRSDLDAPVSDNPSFDGYHVSASWALSGEMRTYNKRSGLFNPLPVSRSVNQGGWGAWEIAARWSTLDLDDGNVQGGDMDIASLGLNWWLTRVAQFSLNYRYVTLDRFGVEGHSSGLTARILLILD